MHSTNNVFNLHLMVLDFDIFLTYQTVSSNFYIILSKTELLLLQKKLMNANLPEIVSVSHLTFQHHSFQEIFRIITISRFSQLCLKYQK